MLFVREIYVVQPSALYAQYILMIFPCWLRGIMKSDNDSVAHLNVTKRRENTLDFQFMVEFGWFSKLNLFVKWNAYSIFLRIFLYRRWTCSFFLLFLKWKMITIWKNNEKKMKERERETKTIRENSSYIIYFWRWCQSECKWCCKIVGENTIFRMRRDNLIINYRLESQTDSSLNKICCVFLFPLFLD